MTEVVTGAVKVPPSAVEAEQAILGALMLDPEAVPKVLQIINAEAFYKDAHRLIFQAIQELFEESEPIDQISVINTLKKKKQLDKVGGAYYITGLVESQYTAANVEYYARIVLQKYILRRLISVSSQVATEAYEERDEVEEILDRAEQLILSISREANQRSYRPIGEVVFDTFEQIERIQKSDSDLSGIPSGLKDLDRFTAGFQPSDFIIIAGRPSMGKTALALTIARNMALIYDIPVGFFSLEMSAEQLVMRLLSSESGINLHDLRSGKISRDEMQRVINAADKLSNVPIYFDDSPTMHILTLRAKARRLLVEKGIRALFIDYLQLIQGPRMENRQQEISAISRSLKALAKELKIPVISLSQLSRAPEGRSDGRPKLSDLRESGAIEQDADLVMFVYRPIVYTKKDEDQGKGEIIIEKQRNGPQGKVPVAFLEQVARFENYEFFTPEELGAPID